MHFIIVCSLVRLSSFMVLVGPSLVDMADPRATCFNTMWTGVTSEGCFEFMEVLSCKADVLVVRCITLSQTRVLRVTLMVAAFSQVLEVYVDHCVL